ncbi:ferredoxin [Nocardioides zeae]|uniref:Ferredoxin n=1 Tax=Nocardioides zeae TaxID=1457234 RepID=A0ACC6IDX3_9ACTN|nr:ferredoxin [Nocardioides zeae]MDR6174082.1 ferredoxin [Nocardioides zeae]MDR6208889.1 ferredoxin [Nocardioides zeae]
MRIVADLDKCEGLGMCEAMAPDFFEVGEDGVVEVLDAEPGEEHRTDLTAAVDACPVLALTLQG